MKPIAARLMLLILLSPALSATAKNIGDVAIPDTLTLPGNGQTLMLNGAGMRKKFFMDIYIGALYLPARTTDSGAILDDTGAASILMHFVYKEVGKDKIVDGWNDGLRQNLGPEEFRMLTERLERFNGLFRAVRRGDVIRIDYNPVIGTEVRINGEWRGSIEGNDFFRALLKVWLGDHPVSDSLKDGMLGIGD